MPQYQICYEASPSVVAALPMLYSWPGDTVLAHQVLRESMHPAVFTFTTSDAVYNLGESDWDFFTRIAEPYNTPGAQSWQQIAHRIGWLDDPQDKFLAGVYNVTWRRFLSAKNAMPWIFRAKVLSEFFKQPAVKAAHGSVPWPTAAGITPELLAQEQQWVQDAMRSNAVEESRMPIGAYIALAMISFGVGAAVSVAITAVAEAAAMAAAEAAVAGATEAAVAATTEGITQTVTQIGINVAEKVITMETMSLITTGDLTGLDPVKLGVAAVTAALPTEIAAIDADVPDLDWTQVLTLTQQGYGLYQAVDAVLESQDAGTVAVASPTPTPAPQPPAAPAPPASQEMLYTVPVSASPVEQAPVERADLPQTVVPATEPAPVEEPLFRPSPLWFLATLATSFWK